MIAAANLHKSFGTLEAVRGVSISVAEGEIYGLVGPDGAGKTTTIRLICGLLQPDEGTAWIGGHSVSEAPELARGQIGYLSQRFSLYEDLTVQENLRFFAEVRGLTAKEWRPRTREILEFVGLAEFSQRPARHLSGGMKKKLGLATALAHQPRALVLDEPTGGVDPVTRQDFWQLIIRLVTEERVAVLISTPYMDEAMRCTRVGFLRAGRMLLEGAPQDLQDRLQGRIIEIQGDPLQLIRRVAKAEQTVEAVQTFGDRLHVRVQQGRAEQTARELRRRIVEAGAALRSLQPITPQLEDVFIALLEDGE